MVETRIVAIACGLLFTTLAARPVAIEPRSEDWVPLHMMPDGLPVVDVHVNGSGPYRFLLDTGSNRSAVSTRLASRLGLRAVARTPIVTAAGTAEAAVVRLDHLFFGEVTRQELLAAAVDTPREFDGVLGQDVLMSERYTIDYAHKRMIWTAAEAAGTSALPLKSVEGRWLVGLQQRAGGPPLWFVPDSGASMLTLFDRGGPLALGARRLDTTALLSTMNREADVPMARVERLDVGSIALRGQDCVIADRHGADAPEGDGLLPLSRFASVTFDPVSRAMTVRER